MKGNRIFIRRLPLRKDEVTLLLRIRPQCTSVSAYRVRQLIRFLAEADQ